MRWERHWFGLLAIWLLGAATGHAGDETIAIERTSHVDHRLVLFDAHDRRFFVPDGEYSNGDGVGIVVREGRIAELRGCGPSPCRLTAHATRIAEDRLSIYAEVAIPDGRYRLDHEAAAGSTPVSFLVEGGSLVELVDASQIPTAPAPERAWRNRRVNPGSRESDR